MTNPVEHNCHCSRKRFYPKNKYKIALFAHLWLQARNVPAGVSESLTILRCLELFGPLDWDGVPERNLQRNWGQVSIPHTALIAAELVKLNESLPSTQKLKRFLLEHPGFIALLGFPLVPAPNHPLGFNALASLPTQQHRTHQFASCCLGHQAAASTQRPRHC